jgi:hypothetical protein
MSRLQIRAELRSFSVRICRTAVARKAQTTEMSQSAKIHERTHLANISAESRTHLELEIGHVLFMDVVRYSRKLYMQPNMKQSASAYVYNSKASTARASGPGAVQSHVHADRIRRFCIERGLD